MIEFFTNENVTPIEIKIDERVDFLRKSCAIYENESG